LNTTSNVCEPCDLGFYQDLEDQLSCKSCPVAHSTLDYASKSMDDCLRKLKI
jgi:hypothetical protein